MGQAGPSSQHDSREASLLPEETQHLVHDALKCFSLVQVLNGAIASLVTLAGYLYKQGSFAGQHCPRSNENEIAAPARLERLRL